MGTLNQSTPLAPPIKPPAFQFSEATRETVRPPTPEDFTVSAKFTIFAGLIVALLALALAVGICRAAHAKVDFVLVLCWFIGWWAIGAASAYIFFIGQIWQNLTGFVTTETIKGPEPQTMPLMLPAETIRMEFHDTSDGGDSTKYADLPARFTEIASGLAAGRPFSEEEWTGSGRPFSVAEFRKLRGDLMERQWLSWKDPRNHSQGVEWSKAGWFVITYLAERFGPPRLGAEKRAALPYSDYESEDGELAPL